MGMVFTQQEVLKKNFFFVVFYAIIQPIKKTLFLFITLSETFAFRKYDAQHLCFVKRLRPLLETT